MEASDLTRPYTPPVRCTIQVVLVRDRGDGPVKNCGDEMNKKNIGRIAACLLLCTFALGMITSFAGVFTLGRSAGGEAVMAREDLGEVKVVDHRIDTPSDANPGWNQEVAHRIDLPSDATPGQSQVVDFRIDLPW